MFDIYVLNNGIFNKFSIPMSLIEVIIDGAIGHGPLDSLYLEVHG